MPAVLGAVIQRANRGLHVPGLDIVVVHRKDGRGTSDAWSDYFSKTNSEWKAEVGSSLAPRFPLGRAAAGNDGAARLVKELGGSIEYVEFIDALETRLSYGAQPERGVCGSQLASFTWLIVPAHRGGSG